MQEGASAVRGRQDGEEQMEFYNGIGERSSVTFAEIIWPHLAQV